MVRYCHVSHWGYTFYCCSQFIRIFYKVTNIIRVYFYISLKDLYVELDFVFVMFVDHINFKVSVQRNFVWFMTWRQYWFKVVVIFITCLHTEFHILRCKQWILNTMVASFYFPQLCFMWMTINTSSYTATWRRHRQKSASFIIRPHRNNFNLPVLAPYYYGIIIKYITISIKCYDKNLALIILHAKHILTAKFYPDQSNKY